MATRSKKGRVTKPTAKKSKQVVEEIPPADLLASEIIQPTTEREPLIEGEGYAAEVSVLKWVPVKDGVIPDNAVEGGWSESTKQVLYIGRVKVSNSLLIGYIDRLSIECYYVDKNSYLETSDSCDILVNCGGSAILKWEKVKGDCIPPNAFESGYSRPGEPVYVGRHSVGKDMLVGYVDPTVGVLQLQKNYRTHSYNEFEVLVVQGSVEIIEEIDHYTLDDIDYNLGEAKTSKVPVILDEVELRNHSSIQQHLKAHSFLEMENAMYCWDVHGINIDYQTKIDGKVPMISSNNELKMSIINYVEYQYGKQGEYYKNGLVAVLENVENSIFSELGTREISSAPSILVIMKLGERLILCSRREETVECNVPPKTEVKVKVQATNDVLEVPFTAHLRKIYKNGMTAEEDVRGIFTSEITAHITNTIDEEKLSKNG